MVSIEICNLLPHQFHKASYLRKGVLDFDFLTKEILKKFEFSITLNSKVIFKIPYNLSDSLNIFHQKLQDMRIFIV